MDIKHNIPLSLYTTYKTGGPADLFFEASTTGELEDILRYVNEKSIPFIFIGGGSNLLFNDSGLRGMAIKNSTGAISFNGTSVAADTGTELRSLISACAQKGLGGLEFLAGIPGTVGGAIYGNAGAYGKSISDILKYVTVWSGGEKIRIERSRIDFSYRHSYFKKNSAIILNAEIEAVKKDRTQIENEINMIIDERKTKHPDSSFGSCGCFFKNVKSADSDRRVAAGKLLQESGGAGQKIGGAFVFEKHCNFILNGGAAKSREIVELAKQLQKQAHEKTGVMLENEVQIIPESPPFKSIAIDYRYQ